MKLWQRALFISFGLFGALVTLYIMFVPVDIPHVEEARTYWDALIIGSHIAGNGVWWATGIMPVLLAGSILVIVFGLLPDRFYPTRPAE